MKKAFILIVSLIFILSLSSCSKGNVKDVKVLKDVSSKVYSDSDIESAMDVVKRQFKRVFKGCTLTTISYAGDDTIERGMDFARRNGASQSIDIVVSFETGSDAAELGLNSDTAYDGYSFTLIRNEGDRWLIASNGYY